MQPTVVHLVEQTQIQKQKEGLGVAVAAVLLHGGVGSAFTGVTGTVIVQDKSKKYELSA